MSLPLQPLAFSVIVFPDSIPLAFALGNWPFFCCLRPFSELCPTQLHGYWNLSALEYGISEENAPSDAEHGKTTAWAPTMRQMT